jgi:hypothetical protein
MDLSELSADILLPHVGTVFRTEAPDGHVHELRLINVSKSADPHISPGATRDQFSLIFAGPLEPPLRQGAYPMRHAVLDDAPSIFIVPIAREKDGYRYEAIFT